MGRRIFASFLDYCLILGWLGLVAAVGIPLYLNGFRPSIGSYDLVSFVASVLPVWLYLTVTEARPPHATYGKRRAGLKVVPASLPRAALRNAVKVLPWQLAHLAVVAWIVDDASATLVSPASAWWPLTGCYLLVALTVALAFLRKDRAALHDLIAGTRVKPA